MEKRKVTIKIPYELYVKLKKIIENTGFSSVTESIVFVMRTIVMGGKIGKKASYTKKEVQEIRKRLKKLGVSDLSISFDAVTPEIFEKIKGKSTGNNYTWEGHWRALLDALDIYGKWHVSTHIIIGFGESERDAINFLQKMNDLGVIVGIMALTPIRGTKIENMKPPDISSYRKIQLAYYLIRHKITNFEKMTFDDSGNLLDFGVSKEILKKVIKSGYPFITTGCSYCNRPYYNESPSGIIYNFPMRPDEDDIRRIRKELGVEDE